MVCSVYERTGGNNGVMTDTNRITFVDAVRDGFRRWLDTANTASRPTFWYWFLFTALLSVVASTADSVLLPPSAVVIPEDLDTFTGNQIRGILDTTLNESLWTVATAVTIWLFIPTLTVTIRRFREAGSSVILAWAIHLIGPFSAYVLFSLGYASADMIDAGVTDANAGSLLLIALSMLALALANLVALIIWIVVAARPAKSTEPR
jgi:uncharacterized membrane protein YhaH (DUF805 family)